VAAGGKEESGWKGDQSELHFDWSLKIQEFVEWL
jgi:hypothetical protein